VAIGDSGAEALRKAKLGDPRSHFGGIIGFTGVVDRLAAEECVKDFCEIVLAPDFDNEALEVFKKKSNIRVIKVSQSAMPPLEMRSTTFGYLMQQQDYVCQPLNEGEVVAGVIEKESKIAKDLELAWVIVSHVKSNAIVIVKDGMLLAAGAGQTSRIDSAQIATTKAQQHGHDLNGAVVASDAFFPFSDTLEHLAKHGVKAIITPSGSKNDPEVIAAAKLMGIDLVFMNERHFRH
jgi:phosphoribosylaminoimidazolecarboxamide formyltransferase/IMP cyclohydrolase